MNITRRFRTIWKFLTPGWLQKGQGEIVQYVQGLMKDAYAERCTQTAYLPYPSVCVSDALDFHGRMRALPRGVVEPEASYRARLVAWRYPRGHRVRGGAPALLEQFSFALRGTFFGVVDARTQWTTSDPDGFDTSTPWQWDDMPADQWGRYWLVARSTGAPWPSFTDAAWLAAWGDRSAVLAGAGVSAGEIDALRKITSNRRLGWTPAGIKAQVLTFYFGSDLFPAPDGTWDDWANRDTRYRYEPLSGGVT